MLETISVFRKKESIEYRRRYAATFKNAHFLRSETAPKCVTLAQNRGTWFDVITSTQKPPKKYSRVRINVFEK